MLAAMDAQARTYVCSPEMEVVSPTGAEAEVNAAGLMTDRLRSAAPIALHVSTHMHTQWKIRLQDNDRYPYSVRLIM